MRLAVVVPAHNEEKTIGDVIDGIPRRIDGISTINRIVINDASIDRTAARAKKAGALVLSHRINIGQGGAVLTGIKAARQLGNALVVTLDGDGQHDPDDIHALVDAHFRDKADLIIGSRFLSQTIETMPALKWYGNKIMNGITFTFSGKQVSDSQSGFRLIGERMLSVIDEFNMTGYEFCSEMIIGAKRHGLLISEVPIKTIYFDGRQGQNPLNGLNIFLRLFYRAVTG
ncbi:MAG TPA: glycosyltransferase family 2 protein [Candidatus Saccharimonadales bacterium]|nr:glycosyltransferase family 2 protein [Candidatus Saccharimonadales bacterium]